MPLSLGEDDDTTTNLNHFNTLRIACEMIRGAVEITVLSVLVVAIVICGYLFFVPLAHAL